MDVTQPSDNDLASGIDRRLLPALSRLRELWEALADGNAPGELKLRLAGPEIAVTFLGDEIELGRLNNKHARTLLVSELKAVELKSVLNSANLLTMLRLITDEVSSGRSDYLATLVDDVREYFNGGSYLRSLVRTLQNIVQGAGSAMDQILLLWLTRQIFIAYRLRGYDGRSMRSLVKDLFFHRESMHDGLLHSTYPYELQRVTSTHDFNNTDPEHLVAYNAALSAELAQLSVSDRFNGITRFWERPAQQLTYLFPVHGIKGNKTLRAGGVEFYAPHISPRLKPENRLSEAFERTDIDALNAAVCLPSVGNTEDRSDAIRAVQLAIDLITFHVATRTPVEVHGDFCQVLRADGSISSASYHNRRFDPAIAHEHMALDLDELSLRHSILGTITSIADRFVDRRLLPRAEQRFDTALREASRADETDVLADRLLSYWIAIEALLSPSGRDGILNQDASKDDAEDVALEVLPALVVNAARYDIGWELHHYLSHAIRNEQNNPFYRDALAGVSVKLRRASQVIDQPWAILH